MTVCDDCITAMGDEMADILYDLTRMELISLCTYNGGDIPDHTCESVDNIAITCHCGCNI